MMGKTRPYVIYPPGWPHTARARTFETFESARRAARRIANEMGMEVRIDLVPRFGGRVNTEPYAVIKPASQEHRDMRADVDLAHSIGLEF